MNQLKFFVLICILVIGTMFSSCNKNKPNDFFTDAVLTEQNIAEDVIATTEFREYDGRVDKIVIYVKNNSKQNFSSGEQFRMQKFEDNEWRDLAVRGKFTAIGHLFEPCTNSPYTVVLKDHIQLPLPPGKYRIGVGFELFPKENDFITYAEFAIK